jgi:hypothetical protein
MATTYKIYGANLSIIEYFEQIIVNCTSDKYELAGLSDSHATRNFWNKK